MNYREKIRKAIACPQFGDETWGEWGILNLEQRRYIKRLLDELDRADNYFKRVYLENKELEQQCKKQIKEYQKALDEAVSEKIDIEDNWNKLKEYLINDINDRNGTKIAEFEEGNRVSETISPIYTLMEDKSRTMKEVLDKMQELEQGSDE